MISERCASAFCNEDISKIENYKQAVNDKTQTWHCHHRAETDKGISRKELISKGLYLNRPAAELIFLTKSEHMRLHGIVKPFCGEKHPMFGKHHSAETKKKMSMSLSGEKNPMFGKHLSEESRKKLSIALSGERNPMFACGEKHPMFGKRGEKCPVFGTHWWNNGTINKRSRECPGQGWVIGRIKFLRKTK